VQKSFYGQWYRDHPLGGVVCAKRNAPDFFLRLLKRQNTVSIFEVG